jgi:hypothetical protein
VKYTSTWKGFDRGREGVLSDPLWGGVLEVLARHEGEDYRDESAPLYDDLEAMFPDEKWIGDDGHQFFRDYSTAWTLTGVLEVRDSSSPGISLTALGRAVVQQRLSREAVFLQAASRLEEEVPNGVERPFHVLAHAFLLLDQREVSLDEIFFGLESGWRPGDGDPNIAINNASVGKIPATPRRRLRAILKIMVELAALEVVGSRWRGGRTEVLRAIVDGTAIDEKALASIPSVVATAAAPELSQAEKDAIQTGEFDDLSSEVVRERVVRSITVRRGQPQFRSKLIKLYDGRCAISEYNASEALEAAHVLAVSKDGTHHAQNGILLRADLHTLFDLRLIGIDPDSWKVFVGNTLAHTSYNKYQGRAVRTPAGLLDRPSSVGLRQHLASVV